MLAIYPPLLSKLLYRLVISFKNLLTPAEMFNSDMYIDDCCIFRWFNEIVWVELLPLWSISMASGFMVFYCPGRRERGVHTLCVGGWVY